MRLLFFICLIFLTPLTGQAQTKNYAKTIAKHRKAYKKDFKTNEHSPLTKKDLKNLNFYEADEAYQVTAQVELVKDARPFKMATYSGKTQDYIKYGVATFQLNNEEITLNIYRSLRLQKMPKYKDYLFMPFKDITNDEATYGGGRYLDFTTKDIKNNQLVIDFNKAYNPYCAYSDGYNCPVPPVENHLEIAINAGEKLYSGAKKDRKH